MQKKKIITKKWLNLPNIIEISNLSAGSVVPTEIAVLASIPMASAVMLSSVLSQRSSSLVFLKSKEKQIQNICIY